jgi:hypothetical protein
MPDQDAINYETEFEVLFPNNTNPLLLDETTFTEVKLTESLLTPGLQGNILIQNTTNNPKGVKNIEEFYNQDVIVAIDRPLLNLGDHNWKSGFTTTQRAYRLEKRDKINENLEQYTLHICDPSLLKDAQTYQRKQWMCQTPSNIVQDCFTGCLGLGSNQFIVESSGPNRDFLAENIHPFKTIQRQAEVADASRWDFSFLHYMTYQNTRGQNPDNDTPTHNFRSLTSLASAAPVYTFRRSPQGDARISSLPENILEYSFPCDFDLLSDILNGYDEEGNLREPVMTYNDMNNEYTWFGARPPGECEGSPFIAWTNKGFEDDSDSCPIEVESWLPRRKARISLLDQDKLALRITVNWNPMLNVGRTINVEFPWVSGANKDGTLQPYSGKYLICHMTHYIKTGGLGFTTMDLVSDSVAKGKTSGR